MPQGRRNGPVGNTNHNCRSVNGAHPAQLLEPFGCNAPIALLEALDAAQLLAQRLQLG